MSTTKSQNKNQQIWDSMYHPAHDNNLNNLNKVRENTDKFIEDYGIKKKIQMTQKIMYKINFAALGEPKNKNDRTDYRYSPKYSCQLEFDHIKIFKTVDGKTIIVTSPYISEIESEKHMDYFNARGFTKIPGLYVHTCPSYVCIV